jgi:hypothetical protein
VTSGVRFFGFKCLLPGKADRLLWVDLRLSTIKPLASELDGR